MNPGNVSAGPYSLGSHANDEVTVTPLVFLDEYKIAKICALEDSCAKIEGVKGAVREVNGPE